MKVGNKSPDSITQTIEQKRQEQLSKIVVPEEITTVSEVYDNIHAIVIALINQGEVTDKIVPKAIKIHEQICDYLNQREYEINKAVAAYHQEVATDCSKAEF